MKRLLSAALLAAICLALPAQAYAYDWSVVTHVSSIEGTYVPSSIDFQATNNAGSCSAGSLLTWNPSISDPTAKAQNVESILALLMTASITGHTVTIYGNNNGCLVEYIYLN